MAERLSYTPTRGTANPKAGNAATPGQVVQLVLQEAQRRGWDWFTPTHAYGIVGSFMQESGNFRKDVLNFSVRGDNGTAHGLMQWRGKRFTNLLAYARANGLEPTDLQTQVMFSLEEADPSSPYRDDLASKTFNALRNSRTIQDAAAAWVHAERPAGYKGNPWGAHDIGSRIKKAEQAAVDFGDGNFEPYQGSSGQPSNMQYAAGDYNPSTGMPVAQETSFRPAWARSGTTDNPFFSEAAAAAADAYIARLRGRGSGGMSVRQTPASTGYRPPAYSPSQYPTTPNIPQFSVPTVDKSLFGANTFDPAKPFTIPKNPQQPNLSFGVRYDTQTGMPLSYRNYNMNFGMI